MTNSYRMLAYDRMLAWINKEEEPKGSNMGPVVDWAVTPWAGKVHSAIPWCAAAVSTAYLEAGYPGMKKIGSLSCDALYAHLSNLEGIKKMEWISAKKVLRSRGLSLWDQDSWEKFFGFAPGRGDLIFFGAASDLKHVGMVDYVDYAMKRIETIEGNHGDGMRAAYREDFFSIVRLP